MSDEWLPKQIALRSFVRDEVRLAGRIAVREFDRLPGVLVGDDAEVALSLDFCLDDSGRPRITGRLEADLPMFCQRCLGVVSVKIRTGFDLVVVCSEEQAKALPKGVESLVLDLEDGTADLHQLVEDELLLSVPLVARHEDAKCHAGQVFSTAPDYSEDITGKAQEGARGRSSPFGVLARLKTGG